MQNHANYINIRSSVLPNFSSYFTLAKFRWIEISDGLRFEVGKPMYNFKMQFFSAPAIPVSLQSFEATQYLVEIFFLCHCQERDWDQPDVPPSHASTAFI